MRAGVIYRHTVDAFVDRILVRRGLLTDDFARQLEALGLDVGRTTGLELETWADVVRAVAARLSPDKAPDDALEQVGREMLIGFSESLAGRGLFLLLRLIGPRRALLRMSENFQSADSVTRVSSSLVGERAVELVFSTTGHMPTYVRGLILEALRQLEARAPSVTFEEGDDATVFFVTWAEDV